MSLHIIEEQLRALKPVLKSQKKARNILENYWADMIPIIWCTEDVHRAANEDKTVLTKAQAHKILLNLYEHHNSQCGLKWSDVSEAIQNSGLGRDIKRNELSRFIHHDELTIDPPQKNHR